ncbi:hypothetical protein QL093DRAFT_2272120 [Fusarium oxysporum]|nr:hypothetical protein QL093DRAFT_2272120 [Fusarium oxysporum]
MLRGTTSNVPKVPLFGTSSSTTLSDPPSRTNPIRSPLPWENLPSLGELESFARLDKTAGTQACRRLFKAVVIWDDLGLDLWETLNSTFHPESDEEDSDDDLLDEISEEPVGWDHASPRRSRSRASSRTSSSETHNSERSRQVSSERQDQRERSRDSRKTASARDQSVNGRLPPRRPMGLQGGMISEYYDSPRDIVFPRFGRWEISKVRSNRYTSHILISHVF